MLLTAISTPVLAGGLYLNEYGTSAMGTAGAGAHALADDASTAFHNPAGMTRVEGEELMVSGGLLYYDMKFDPAPDTPIPGGDGGSAGGPGPILGAFYTRDLSEDWDLGLSLVSISAALIDYENDWTGRYLVQDVTILTISAMPSVSYRVNDRWSLGAGAMVMYASLDEKIAAPPPLGTGQVKIDGDDFEFGFNLSTLYELDDDTRFGLLYVSEMTPTFGGDVEITPPDLKVGIDAGITFPQMVRLSGYHEVNSRWALLGTVGWENWSAFENITLSTAKGSQVLPRNWDDTWHFGAGAHYRVNGKWLLQFGAAYDTSPVGASDRTPDMPMDRQIRLSIGAQYSVRDDLTIGGAFTFADYGDAKIDNELLKGDYKKNNIYFFAINANWKL
jgi:long-chain fatty acid transport protein